MSALVLTSMGWTPPPVKKKQSLLLGGKRRKTDALATINFDDLVGWREVGTQDVVHSWISQFNTMCPDETSPCICSKCD
jgi:hypothetical protein